MKLRIAAAAAVGVALIGIFAWPLSEPSQTTGAITHSGAAILLALGLAAGFIGFFVSWPYGREIGILAVPFGLAVWAVRSGTMAGLIQLNPTDVQRHAVVQSLRWQPVFWLVLVAAGFVGPLLCMKILSKPKPAEREQGKKPNPGLYLSPIIAVAAAAAIAYLGIGIFVQDVRLSDEQLGFVSAQPALGQLAFGVLVAFGFAAFAVRKLLGIGYIWPIIASVFVTTFAMSTYSNNLPYLAQQWPAVFFSSSVASVLPSQMVAFGALGSVAGYWMAARYDYWRENEI
jgi:hypothetical protein